MKGLIYNAKIYLERGRFAEALSFNRGKICKVGSNVELEQWLKEQGWNKKKIFSLDCEGKTVVPGFNDSHMHFMMLGENMNQAPIDSVRSISEMITVCRQYLVEHPERVTHCLHAMGWNQDLFEDEKRIPTREDLDQISTEIPVILERVCGHILTTNSKAIEMLGLNASSPQYPDGEIRFGADGEPNGIFTENACNFVKALVPDTTSEQRRQSFLDNVRYALALGVTSVQSNDIGTTLLDGDAGFELLREIYAHEKVLMRYHHQVCFNDLESFKAFLGKGEHKRPQHGKWLTMGPLKLFKDGSLGARTAQMRQDYADDPGNRGVEWIKDEDMAEFCALAKKHRMQVVTHVIGDAAIEATINAYCKAFIKGKNKLRHALVHCQITDKALVERIAREDILVMAQPIFLDYDMRIVEDRCGKALASTSYAFGSLKRLGAHVSYGTDCPVESYDPFQNIYMAVTRKDKKGLPEGGFYPKESVDVYDAVDAYTYESAYAEFMENEKGRLHEGFLADMVVLDKDIFTVDPMEIKDIRPVMTIVGGEIAYSQV